MNELEQLKDENDELESKVLRYRLMVKELVNK